MSPRSRRKRRERERERARGSGKGDDEGGSPLLAQISAGPLEEFSERRPEGELEEIFREKIKEEKELLLEREREKEVTSSRERERRKQREEERERRAAEFERARQEETEAERHLLEESLSSSSSSSSLLSPSSSQLFPNLSAPSDTSFSLILAGFLLFSLVLILLLLGLRPPILPLPTPPPVQNLPTSSLSSPSPSPSPSPSFNLSSTSSPSSSSSSSPSSHPPLLSFPIPSSLPDSPPPFYSQVQLLDKRSRILLFPQFLSEEEISQLVRLGSEEMKKDFGPSWKNRTRASLFFGGKSGDPALRRNLSPSDTKLLQQIEERIALVTVIPPHDAELGLMLSYTSPRSPKNELLNVHHSLNAEENRVFTLTIFLNDVEEGGRLIFPTLGGSALNLDLWETFSRAFQKENRRILFSPPHWNSTAFNLSSSMCHSASSCLQIHPKRGTAFLYPSRHVDGSPIPWMWVGSCRVVRGEKLTLHKFKEIPREHGEWVLKDWSMEHGSKYPPRWVEFANSRGKEKKK